ncbi:membrane bound O-acyl transferase MBOAT family protein [Crinalium epipsammum PCC 9333]|uniref:Membrane bound O-acyl transferase MBOAT family protein n=1 Tax=Crinalium epipsammum PCC 9333 TaxID=1173022 RepID=K9VV64_9CYAN|nr:MBOAT family protein [Crinalium epipsammum]AFZ11866.1 membrane bound O-acyl transferase MBOAT family protein [Crinalium epipsammum PCC 9333]
MSFVSPIYGLFILILLGIYWLVRSAYFNVLQTQSFQLCTIIIFSLFFYATLQIQYIPLLIVIAVINFALGRIIGDKTTLGKQAKNPKISNQGWQQVLDRWQEQRRLILLLGIALNVLLLLGFKYIPFLLTTIASVFNLPVVERYANWVSDRLIAPLGISFFTFECIAYLIDVYRGAQKSEKLLNFLAYKLFFPKAISGPITRYHYFAEQLKTLQFPSLDWIAEGLWLITCGAIKKALVADNLGRVVDVIWGAGNLERAGSGDLWLATFAYGFQLYLDFSGYVDIARGSAILLGFNLPENFNFPYFTTSIAQFWRRWHITLGDWLRNYLYFPLGGSRQGLQRTCLNLLIIMLVAGIWHGAAWGYVVWGALHGIGLVVHRLTEAISMRYDQARHWWNSWSGAIVAWLITQLMVFITWIFFRLPDLKQSGLVFSHLWGYQADSQFVQKVYREGIGLEAVQLAWLLILLGIFMAIVYGLHKGLKLQLNWHVKLLLVPVCLFAVWLLAPEGGLPYIYFDF